MVQHNQTRQINYVAAGTADTDAVNVAQLKSVNLSFTGDTGSGDVNLANSKLAVNGDDTYITTTANGKKITIAGKNKILLLQMVQLQQPRYGRFC